MAENETESGSETGQAPVKMEMVYEGVNSDPDKIGSVEVEAKKNGKMARVFFDYGDNLDEMRELFGDGVVFSNARGKMIVGLQAALRARLVTGSSIADLMSKYKPGVSLERIPTDMGAATENYFDGLSEDEQDAMISRLMKKKEG